MGVRAKFYIRSIELLPGKDAGGIVNLTAVGRGDRNAQWASATPNGTMVMTINNPPALQFFTDLLEQSRTNGRYPELFIDIAPALDGYIGDGHEFRLADVDQESHYLRGKCGECGEPLDRHDSPEHLGHEEYSRRHAA